MHPMHVCLVRLFAKHTDNERDHSLVIINGT